MSIPIPTVSDDDDEVYTSKCELYDGSSETAGLCKGFITSTHKCIRRDDEMGQKCDGYGKFPDD